MLKFNRVALAPTFEPLCARPGCMSRSLFIHSLMGGHGSFPYSLWCKCCCRGHGHRAFRPRSILGLGQLGSGLRHPVPFDRLPSEQVHLFSFPGVPFLLGAPVAFRGSNGFSPISGHFSCCCHSNRCSWEKQGMTTNVVTQVE